MTLLESISPTARELLRNAECGVRNEKSEGQAPRVPEATSLPVIKFRHAYYKLMQEEFTTIRGAAQYRKWNLDQMVEIRSPGQVFTAQIYKLQQMAIKDFTLDFLKTDAEYHGLVISSHEDFVRLLNSFRAPFWKQVTLESQMTVFYLRRCSENPRSSAVYQRLKKSPYEN